MELERTSDGLVTPLALWRAARGIPHKTLGTQVGQTAQWVLDAERLHLEPKRSELMRLGMALRVPWSHLEQPPMPYSLAWENLLKIRRRLTSPR